MYAGKAEQVLVRGTIVESTIHVAAPVPRRDVGKVVGGQRVCVARERWGVRSRCGDHLEEVFAIVECICW